MYVCLGSVYGCDVAGACRPPVTSRGPRARANKRYQTLPSQSHCVDQHILPLTPTTTRCVDQRPPLVARAVGVDCRNIYGRRSSSDANCVRYDQRSQQLYVSDVDLTSCSVDRCESTAWKRPPSITDLSSTANGDDQCTVMFGDLLHGGLSLEALPDTHL